MPSPGALAQSTSRRTSRGWVRASAWAIIPPIDQPSTSGLRRRSARISEAVSLAIPAIVSLPRGAVLRPTPALSKTITLCRRASASTNDGIQLSIVADSPVTRTSGRPDPTER